MIDLLIGRNREQPVVGSRVCVLLQYGSRNIEQRDIDRDFRLVASGVDPQPAVVTHNHFGLLQSPHVGIGEAREATEDENIFYPLQPFRGHLFRHERPQLVDGQMFAVRLLHRDFESAERIGLHPAVVLGCFENRPKALDHLHMVVVPVLTVYRTQVDVEIVDEFRVDVRQQNILHFVLRSHELGQPATSQQITCVSLVCSLFSDKCLVVFIELVEEHQQPFGLVAARGKNAFQPHGRNRLAAEEELVVLVSDYVPVVVERLVDVLVLGTLAECPALLTEPTVGIDIESGGQMHHFAVDRNPCQNRRFAVGLQLPFLCDEKNRKCAFVIHNRMF